MIKSKIKKVLRKIYGDLDLKYVTLSKIDLDEIKQIELDILDEFASFCDENNLKYSLDGGTLLGAIRHKGFIPWDDDIDVIMPLPDFLRFIEMYSGNQKYEIKYGKKDGFHFAKLCDSRTVVRKDFRDESKLYGIWIDIFPMYSIDNDDSIALKDINRMLHYEKKYWNYLGYKHIINPFKRMYHYLVNDFMLSLYLNKIDSIAKKHQYGTTDRIRFIPVLSSKLSYTTEEHFVNQVKMQFEGKYFWGPSDYDTYLQRLYGDYMKLPPKGERITHEVEAYWK